MVQKKIAKVPSNIESDNSDYDNEDMAEREEGEEMMLKFLTNNYVPVVSIQEENKNAQKVAGDGTM